MKNTTINKSTVLLFLIGSFLPLNAQTGAIRQLEIITGQSIDRGGRSSSSDASAPATVQINYGLEFTNFVAAQANDENNAGVKKYNKKKWKAAARHFRRATKYQPDVQVYQDNLRNALYQVNAIKSNKKEAKLERKEKKTTDRIFLKTYNDDMKHQAKQVKKLRKQLASYVPPLPQREVIHEGVILGMSNTDNYNKIVMDSLKSPFTGKQYKSNEVYATTDNKAWTDFYRAFKDNSYSGYYTLNTDLGKELVKKLSNKHFDRLLAHSNGASVTEALIRENIIEVEELNILGGDRSVINYFGWKDLLESGKVKRIVIWINPGDVVPLGSTAGLLSPAIGAREQYKKTLASYINYKLTGTGNDSKVEYRYLSGPPYQAGQEYQFNENFFDAHGIDAYFANLKAHFSQKKANTNR